MGDTMFCSTGTGVYGSGDGGKAELMLSCGDVGTYCGEVDTYLTQDTHALIVFFMTEILHHFVTISMMRYQGPKNFGGKITPVVAQKKN